MKPYLLQVNMLHKHQGLVNEEVPRSALVPLQVQSYIDMGDLLEVL